jgi:dephospho-CoA kinase
MKKKMILGIAGYISSGKSEAGRYFEKEGAYFINADEVVGGLYKQGNDGWRKIVSFFGREFLRKNGEINRKRLAKFVFSDGKKLKIINGLIHPLVVTEIRRLIAGSDKEFIAVEASYFEEGKLLEMMDKIMWVDCDRAKLKKRAIRNNGITGQMFEQIISVQRRPAKVDFTVDNSGSKAEFHRKLRSLGLRINSSSGIVSS